MALRLTKVLGVNRRTSSTRGESSSFNLIDLYEGQKDLDRKLIRSVGNPDERFSEDALRMMRAIRIAAELGFVIEEKTFEAIKKNAGLINKIAKERIKEELFKLLSSPNPYDGMLLLRNSGLMLEILPEMEKAFGVEQKSPGRHHIYDVGTHLLMSLKLCKSTDPLVRFAAMIHDIGKPQTYKKLSSGVITFYNHEIISARITTNIADSFRLSRKEKERLISLVRWHQFTVNEDQTDSAIRRFIRNVGKDNLKDILEVRVADRLGGGARETSCRLEEFKKRLIEVQKQPFTVQDLKIDGNDVMKKLGLTPGPKVGEVLEKLFNEVVENKLPNEREGLLIKLSEYKN
jgi:tRNA nucleotidyltransferase/poly(A) polymerase